MKHLIERVAGGYGNGFEFIIVGMFFFAFACMIAFGVRCVHDENASDFKRHGIIAIVSCAVAFFLCLNMQPR